MVSSYPSQHTSSLNGDLKIEEPKHDSFLPEVGSDEFLPAISKGLSLSGLALSVAVAASIGIASVTEYKVTVKADATARPAGEIRLVQSGLEGSIKQVFVKENQTVQKGELIAALDDSQLQIKKSQLVGSIQQLKLQQTQIEAQSQSLRNQIQAEASYRDRSISSAQSELLRTERELQDRRVTAQSEVLAAQATLDKSQADLEKAEADALFAQQDRHRYRSLVAVGAVAQRELDLKQQALDQAQSAVKGEQKAIALYQAKLQAAKAVIDPSQAGVAIAQSKISQEADRGDATIASLKKDLQAFTQRQTELLTQIRQQEKEIQQQEAQLLQTQIRATYDGVLLKLNLRNGGQVIRAGDEVAQIAPSGAEVVIKANVATQDIQKIATGQIVQMRVAACPYTDFGVLEGQVMTISPDAIASGGNGAGSGGNSNSKTSEKGNSSHFEVTAKPNSQMLSRQGRDCALQSGMTMKTNIIAQQDTVLKFLLRKARLLSNL